MDELDPKDDDELKEVELPEPEEDEDGLPVEEDDLLLGHHGKKHPEDGDESLEDLALAEEEELVEDSYDDEDKW